MSTEAAPKQPSTTHAHPSPPFHPEPRLPVGSSSEVLTCPDIFESHTFVPWGEGGVSEPNLPQELQRGVALESLGQHLGSSSCDVIVAHPERKTQKFKESTARWSPASPGVWQWACSPAELTDIVTPTTVPAHLDVAFPSPGQELQQKAVSENRFP